MPFESSLPLVAACLLGAVVVFFIWTRVQDRWLLAGTAALVIAGIAAFVADSLVVTDREYLLALFPRLARAAEKQDVATIMAALDRDLRPLRDEAERVLKQVRPTEVLITSIDVAVDPARKPPEAVAKLIVRVTGNVIDKSTPGTVLAGVKVLLHKKDGQWLVKDAEGEQVKPGQGR
ncbi:MAG: hypothetical protein ACKO1M_04860 [Planctomycetota bacterium]